MRIKKIPIDKINPAPYNPRLDLQPGDPEYEKIKRSIEEFGLVEILIWNERTGNLVGGHQRLKVLKELGYTETDVSIVDLPPSQEKALNIALNKISGDWDNDKLQDLLSELNAEDFDLTLTGFDSMETNLILDLSEIVKEDNFHDDPPENPVTKKGELWKLGSHRLLCGDSTKISDIGKLMFGELADLVITDPPYNVNYGDKAAMLDKYQKGHRNTNHILNDNMDDQAFAVFLTAAFKAMAAAMKEGAPIYVFHADSQAVNFRKSFADVGFYLAQCLVWVKNSLVLGRQDYQWIHESILYGWKPGAAHPWYGLFDKTTVYSDRPNLRKMTRQELIELAEEFLDGKYLTTVIREDRPAKSGEHPTMKPVKLMANLMLNSSKEGDIVLDPFGGSGSTLIAAEQLGRTCYTMELDEKYCDVIINRWEGLTGQKAELIKNENA